MKKIISNSVALRIFSLLSLLIFIIVVLFNGCLNMIPTAVFSGDVILLLHPLPSQDVRTSFVAALAVFIVLLLCLVSGLPSAVTVSVGCAYLVAYAVFRCAARFRKVRTLFKANNVMTFVQDYSQLFYISAFFAVSVIYASFSDSLAGRSLLLAAYSVLYIVLYVRAYTSRTLLLDSGRERQINEISRGEVRNVPVEYNLDDTRMAAIYKQIVDVMEEKKPYLDPSFSIYDLSQIVYTNKTYVSRIIGIYSGRNFCQFVNYYRVRHAAGLIAGDSSLKVTELALMSGFNSSVTFNAAFRAFIGTSPGEYLQRMDGEKLKK